MISPRRLILIVLATAAILLAVAACALLTVPLWIDADAIKRQIATRVHEATGDTVTLDRLHMRVFPAVSIEVEEPRYAAAGVAEVAARRLRIDLAFWPLLSGKANPRSIELEGLDATVQLPAPDADAKPLTRAQLEQRVREVLATLRRAAPDMRAVASDARVTLIAPGRPTLTLQNLRARIDTGDDGVTLAAESRSELWQRLSFDLALGERDLAGRGHAEFVDLDAAGLMRYAGIEPADASVEGRLLGTLDWRMQGLARVEASARLSTPSLLVRAGEATQSLDGLVAAASVQLRGEVLDAQLERLYLRSPRVLGGGSLRRDEHGRLAFSLDASDVALADVQAVAANLAPHASWVRKPPVTLRSGTISALALHGSADDFSGFADATALWGEATLHDAAVDVAKPALRLTGIAGDITFDRGQLEASRVSVTLGHSVLREGKLSARVLADAQLQRAQGTIDVDLAEATALTRSIVTRKDVRAELDALEEIQGRAMAGFELVARRGGMEAAVDLTQIALFVRHRYVPLPLRIEQGRLRYARGALALEGIAGQLGRAAIGRLDASLQLAPPHEFELSGSDVRLTLEELYAALRKVPAAAPMYEEIGALSGRATVAGFQARGTLDAPAATQFQVSIAPHATKALVTRLATDVLLDGGEVTVTERDLELRDVGMETLDSKLRLSARAPGYRAGLPAIELQGEGEIGANTVARVEQEAQLPAAWRLRAPLRVSAMSAAWQRNGNASLTTGIRFADATDIGIAARKSGESIRIDRLTIRDAASDATVSAHIAGFNIDLAFKGRLAGASLANVLVAPPFQMQELEGDIKALVHTGKPWISTGNGRLAGRGIAAGAYQGEALFIDQAEIVAGEGKIHIEKSDLRVGENRVQLRGDVMREDDKLALDIELRSPKVVLPRSLTHGESQPREQPLRIADLPVKGRVRLDIAHLETENITIAPLVADARTAGNEVDVEVVRAALCELNLSGRLKGALDDLQLDGALTARDAVLENTIACLTSGRVVGTGRFNSRAQFKSHGTFSTLGHNLGGEFTADAHDGVIESFDTLNRVFAFLNVTEVVRGKKLGVDSGGLPYHSITLKGRLEGRNVHLDEGVLDAPTVRVAATGHLDYGSDRLAMDVLVAPLQTANVIIEKIPLVNRIFGETVLALPVQVLGSPSSPLVVPLGPGAITRRMTSIITNTLKLPLDAVRAVTAPDASAGDKGQAPSQ